MKEAGEEMQKQILPLINSFGRFLGTTAYIISTSSQVHRFICCTSHFSVAGVFYCLDLPEADIKTARFTNL